jgi:hypothetical protein
MPTTRVIKIYALNSAKAFYESWNPFWAERDARELFSIEREAVADYFRVDPDEIHYDETAAGEFYALNGEPIARREVKYEPTLKRDDGYTLAIAEWARLSAWGVI